MKLKLTKNQIRPQLRKIDRRLNGIAPQAHKFFVQVTPFKTGNAKRRTRLQGQTIKADYPYASRLDEGYSRQAPEGMSQPTIEYIKKLVRKITGG